MAAIQQGECIVVATDGSPGAHHAVAAAAERAAARDAELVAVHVLAATEYRVARFGPLLPVARRHPDPFEDPVLLDARRLAWRLGAPAILASLSGDAAEVITDLVMRRHGDVLVLGRRRRAARPLGAGQLARHAHRHAHCRVLEVDQPPRTSATARSSV
jgi:nucleotide-binding universal stress UspA family protein